jgi:hypothetical protein
MALASFGLTFDAQSDIRYGLRFRPRAGYLSWASGRRGPTLSSIRATAPVALECCAIPAGRPTHRPVRKPRPLTELQLRKRMEAMMAEIEGLAAGHQLSAGRLSLLQRQVQVMFDRWPRG